MEIGTFVNYVQLALWLGAIALFASKFLTGKKSMPKWFSSNKLVGIVIVLGLIATGLSFYLNWRNSPWDFDKDRKLVEVSGRVFRSEKVVLDGHQYTDCTFDNVTFTYNGTALVNFSHNTISGNVVIESDNPSVVGTLDLVRGLGLVRSDIPIFVGPNWTPSKVQAPTEAAPSPQPSLKN